MTDFDVIVVGGGHAGIEAALGAARLGCRVALVTFERSGIGRMSCNPAIGGVAKGQIVREIDALGGAMGQLIDATGIQFRMLNTSKGAAVISPRAQADKAEYSRAARDMVEGTAGVTVIEGEATSLIVDCGLRIADSKQGDDTAIRNPQSAIRNVSGVRLADGREIRAPRVILTTGTFLGGLMHCGEEQTVGGRVGEKASVGLSAQLRELGFRMGRLKTGTPPRLDGDTIDWSRVEEQRGDDPPQPFSFLNARITQPQVSCYITHTNERTHEIIARNLHRSPLYSGQIQGRGPRYCPSIEDKIKRFADKSSHNVFLEPEGLSTRDIYPNGISTSLPRDVQDEIIASIAGLEKARIVRYGYAVEYDFVPPTQIFATMETKLVRGLYLAGQINGTTGYEEAAAQGLMAGLNAALSLQNKEPLVLRRDQAYIGVLIDDLTTRGTDEPYRMFTSLAEYRLRLRSDNADLRLTPIANARGFASPARTAVFEEKRATIEQARHELESTRRNGKSVWEWLRSPNFSWDEALAQCPKAAGLAVSSARTLETEARYAGYVELEEREIGRMRDLECIGVPPSLDFANINALRKEAREKLAQVRPANLGQASRIPGIGPGDLSVLRVYLASR
ncbi:MAG: tRNA uridine-5-carboxymethylaminomethyl(34) synthesis enzyme MnmG [Planctomycetes bacterium]|nr:tRNA uridine-5-carboxymethylaminomethyl(34) synthesis enzyme MnmG [Planctomycetota bacterium]